MSQFLSSLSTALHPRLSSVAARKVHSLLRGPSTAQTTSPRTSIRMASDLSVELTAPNGRKYTQPTGLFINNEWVKSSDGGMFASINPRYVSRDMSGSRPRDLRDRRRGIVVGDGTLG